MKSAPPAYVPGAPLYAREPLRFSGVDVQPGSLIPERPERQRRILWETHKATHVAPQSRGTATVAYRPKKRARTQE